MFLPCPLCVVPFFSSLLVGGAVFPIAPCGSCCRSSFFWLVLLSSLSTNWMTLPFLLLACSLPLSGSVSSLQEGQLNPRTTSRPRRILLLLGGAAFLLSLVGWCCLAPPSFGSCVRSLPPCPSLLVSVSASRWRRPTPTQKRRRRKANQHKIACTPQATSTTSWNDKATHQRRRNILPIKP